MSGIARVCTISYRNDSGMSIGVVTELVSASDREAEFYR